MILADEKNNGMRLQVINEEMIQGVFDSGEIVDSIDYQMLVTDVKPSDYFAREVKESIEFIKSFLLEAREGKDFELKAIDESKSLYLPRLYTDVHAWIDWRRWNANEIERFIRAFDDPYMGARTTLGGKYLRLKDVELISDSTNYHPFQSGLVVRKYNDQVMICCSGGMVAVSKITDDGGNDLMNAINIGDRLFTSEDEIEKSLNYSAVYDSAGLKD
jgi:methionyl-tRNA formyltransferase